MHSAQWLGGYVFDNELIIVNGLITFVGLLFTSSAKEVKGEKIQVKGV
jgi:hypothetical protein